jgi:AraC-like DNA-binding protein
LSPDVQAGTRYPPLLCQWGARALYIGPAFGLSPHRNAVAVLAVGLDGPFDLAELPGDPSRGFTRCRSALIPPNTLHQLSANSTRMAFLYLDALSSDFARLANVEGWSIGADALAGLACERRLTGILLDLDGGAVDFASARHALERDVLGASRDNIPAKVLEAIHFLNRHAFERPSLADLARRAGLSPSRFRRVFVTATGVPLRRYRIWAAMGMAMRIIARGRSLTEAAHEAGFSSSAHFSSAFRDMFGMAPSSLAGLNLAHSRRKRATTA